MWLMLQQDTPSDYVIATGRTVSLSYFVEQAFAHFKLDWRAHVQTDDMLLRPSDIAYGAGDPALAARVLGWAAQHDVDSVIQQMCLPHSLQQTNSLHKSHV
jgi:GDPmannose 4,6-dehydratase